MLIWGRRRRFVTLRTHGFRRSAGTTVVACWTYPFAGLLRGAVAVFDDAWAEFDNVLVVTRMGNLVVLHPFCVQELANTNAMEQ